MEIIQILETLEYHAKQITLALDGFPKLVRKRKMKPRHMKVKPYGQDLGQSPLLEVLLNLLCNIR